MEPTLDIGERVLVNRVNYRLERSRAADDIVVFHPPEGAVDGRPCGVSHRGRPALPAADRGRARTSTSSSGWWRVPGDTLAIRDGHAVVNGKRAGRVLHGALHRRGMLVSEADQDSAGSLFYDGRQPWRERRQPLLGTGPREMDHRTGLLHLLADQPKRRAPLKSRPSKRTAQADRAAAVPVRPVARAALRRGRGRGRSRQPRGAAGRGGGAVRLRAPDDRGRCARSAGLDDSKVHDVEQRE